MTTPLPPTPWKPQVTAFGHTTIRDAEDRKIAVIMGGPDMSSHIAVENLVTAAPDLLAACEAMMAALDIFGRRADDREQVSCARNIMANAIAKAKRRAE